jgi:hypothetical protein
VNLLSSSGAISLELDVRTSTVARPKLCDKERRLCRREDLVPVDKEDGWQVVKSRKQSRCDSARRDQCEPPREMLQLFLSKPSRGFVSVPPSLF